MLTHSVPFCLHSIYVTDYPPLSWAGTEQISTGQVFFYVVDVLSLLNSFEDEINGTSLFSYNNGK